MCVFDTSAQQSVVPGKTQRRASDITKTYRSFHVAMDITMDSAIGRQQAAQYEHQQNTRHHWLYTILGPYNMLSATISLCQNGQAQA